VELWAYQLRIPLRCVIIGIAALLLVFWQYPTGLVVISIVIIGLLALLALEFLIRPARAARTTDTIEAATAAQEDTRVGRASPG
jgi:hypothetical protein